MRGPSNIPTESIPEDPSLALPPVEEREPRPYSSTGSWSRRKSARDRSASFGSPPRPTPEVVDYISQVILLTVSPPGHSTISIEELECCLCVHERQWFSKSPSGTIKECSYP